jgi:hypothetical protein
MAMSGILIKIYGWPAVFYFFGKFEVNYFRFLVLFYYIVLYPGRLYTRGAAIDKETRGLVDAAVMRK